MHTSQRLFCELVREKFPEHFRVGPVIDIGSYDVNGNNRYLFSHGDYVGIDLVHGPNVDRVSLAHELSDPDGLYRVVISTNMLEHDPNWRASLRKMVSLLAPGGLLLVTCPGPGFPEHGTARTGSLWASPANQVSPGWENYYRALTSDDIMTSMALSEFDSCECVMPTSEDTFFWGIKRQP